MQKIAFIPIRRAEIIGLAQAAAKKYRELSLDEIAERENIILVRQPDPTSKKAGYAAAFPTKKLKRLKSASRPGEFILSFTEIQVTYHDCIVINPQYGIPEREVFWHEYYHLWYSPSRKMKMDLFQQFSTGGTLDSQEERRANIFAAYMLIPQIEKGDTVQSICEKWGVSLEMAEIRLGNS